MKSMKTEEDTNKIRDFTDLFAWQESHQLVLGVYRMTKSFPDTEKFGLVSQMRRSAVSITSNIAEGFGRRGPKDKLRFYYHSQGSLLELKNQIMIARDVDFMSGETSDKLLYRASQAHRLLQGLITKSKSILNS